MDSYCERPHVLLTGDCRASEFQDTVSWIQQRADAASFPQLSDAAAYLRRATTDPLLIVIAQSFPDQFSLKQVERLHRAAPLSRMAALLGSWCEGEYRSGRPWPGVMRLYWHQFQSRLARFIDSTPPESRRVLPRTSTIAEQLGADDPVPSGRHEGLIAVRTPRYTDFDALAESFRQSGYACIWLRDRSWREVRGATAVVWDGGHSDWSLPAQIAEVSGLSQMAPVVALLDFPRRQDLALIRQAGASAVVSRPFLVDDLLCQIHQCHRSVSPVRFVA